MLLLNLRAVTYPTLPSYVLHRVDVTEVQFAIIIMYVMSAFGGVSLWQYTVTENPFLHTRLHK